MRDPEITKFTILQKSGVLFNTHGYKATSLSEITEATGLTKGAIYRHFKNKQELEKKTLYFLSSLLYEKMRDVIRAEPTAGKKLRAVLTFFNRYITDPPIKGGCPLLNAAIEADDSNPSLKSEALKILENLRNSLIQIMENGVKHSQLKKDIDKNYYATLIIASLEGAIMMSKLKGDNADIRLVIRHLESVIAGLET